MKPDEKEAASLDEIIQAIAGLAPADLLRLQKFARFRMAALGALSRGRDYEDLLSEAMTATLEGRRVWRMRSVTFVNHLMAVMRSTSDNWATRDDQRELSSEELHRDFDGGGYNDEPLDSVAATNGGQEQKLIEKEALEALEASVSDDIIARDVLSALQLGLRGQELKATLEITEDQLRAATKKIERRVQALQPLFAGVASGKK